MGKSWFVRRILLAQPRPVRLHRALWELRVRVRCQWVRYLSPQVPQLSGRCSGTLGTLARIFIPPQPPPLGRRK
jgi:hypothetical protein